MTTHIAEHLWATIPPEDRNREAGHLRRLAAELDRSTDLAVLVHLAADALVGVNAPLLDQHVRALGRARREEIATDYFARHIDIPVIEVLYVALLAQTTGYDGPEVMEYQRQQSDWSESLGTDTTLPRPEGAPLTLPHDWQPGA